MKGIIVVLGLFLVVSGFTNCAGPNNGPYTEYVDEVPEAREVSYRCADEADEIVKVYTDEDGRNWYMCEEADGNRYFVEVVYE